MSIPFFTKDKVDSTMSEIKKDRYNRYLIAAVIANQQTEGRGRRNNTWISNKGNFYLSVRIKNKIKKNYHLTTYMAGIVVYNILKIYLRNNLDIFIKWPNDILINNKKVGGILIESVSTGGKVNDVIIGIGININHNPFFLKNTTTHLSKYSNLKVINKKLAKEILSEIDCWTKILNYNKTKIIKEWMNRSKKKNTNIRFYYNNHLHHGVYKGIGKDGAIKVLMNNKINHFFNIEIT